MTGEASERASLTVAPFDADKSMLVLRLPGILATLEG